MCVCKNGTYVLIYACQISVVDLFTMRWCLHQCQQVYGFMLPLSFSFVYSRWLTGAFERPGYCVKMHSCLPVVLSLSDVVRHGIMQNRRADAIAVIFSWSLCSMWLHILHVWWSWHKHWSYWRHVHKLQVDSAESCTLSAQLLGCVSIYLS